VAFVVGGVYFGTQAKSAADEVSDLAKMGGAWTPRYDRLEAQGQRDQKVSIALLGVGAAAVVGGGILYYLGASEDAEARRHVSVDVTSTSAQVVFTWSR
jgi:hypothetical protein